MRKFFLIAAWLAFAISSALADEANTNDVNSNLNLKEPSLQPLSLCDCHYAEDGLVSCPLDGFFVAGFRSAGYPLNHNDEVLPLSPAICCRPCMPDDASLTDDKAVAVVTRNCAPALSKNQQQCEHSSGTLFLQGFEKARLVPSVSEYFPHGSAQCCQPALLLGSGLVKPLVRCACDPVDSASNQVSCTDQAGVSQNTPAHAQAGGKLLWGYEHAIAVESDFPVPSGPAQCCRVCLDPSVPSERPEQCEVFDFCNGHGSCMFGQCKCTEGWRGDSCYEHTGNSLTVEQVLTIIARALAIAVTGLVMGSFFKAMLVTCSRRRHMAARAAAR
eukprot:CAMPEP_0198228300 /NCGR_PEP_ID=MMETSP1445-20131203/112707_1 /TAXON_ID=36898 /ORGANISM="Pyramimonas sp., Strain CCMP2087" /LENGTH=329 /DNA_ID=CAMNT_0043908621 /DNA_START=80 /DNA_END=1065 /DNA_ORIENTATION=-